MTDTPQLAAPAFPITVPEVLWKAMASAVRETFADSYLWGAKLSGNYLEPRTVTAWYALDGDFNARKTLKELGITLVKPEPFNGTDKKADSFGRPSARDLPQDWS